MSIRGMTLVASAIGLGTFLTPDGAMANQPATANSVQLGVGFRYGFDMDEGDYNAWGVGLGLDAGYTLPNAIYVGGNFEYFFGFKEEVLGGDVTGNVWQLMANGGYDLGLGENLVLRPKVGVGYGHLSAEACVPNLGCQSDSEGGLALAPGASFLVITEKFRLSVDLRYAMILTDPDTKAIVLTAGVGF